MQEYKILTYIIVLSSCDFTLHRNYFSQENKATISLLVIFDKKNSNLSNKTVKNHSNFDFKTLGPYFEPILNKEKLKFEK